MTRKLLTSGLSALCVVISPLAHAERVRLALQLQPGQVIRYEASYQTDKLTKTVSRFVQPDQPEHARMAVSGIVEVRVLELQKEKSGTSVRARALFLPLDARDPNPGAKDMPKNDGAQNDGAKNPAAPSASMPDSARAAAAPPQHFVDFTISSIGRIGNIKGLEALPPEQQQAWLEWAARFAAVAIIPRSGMKPGDKWKSEDAEKAASPIAGLTWMRESSYVDNEPCKPMQLTSSGDVLESGSSPETCAVILTTATLRQKSSPQDTTPADFKVRQLHTSGYAGGANKIISYISLKTGLLVRGSEEASQSMTVTVAKTDGSNSVHYDVNASSHSEVVQLLPPPSSAESAVP